MSVNWTRESAAHLLRRAGFGGTPAEIDALYARGLEGAVSYLVDYDGIDVSAYEASLAAKRYNLQRVSGLQQWFMDRMAFSPRPLEEKMTYFWNLHWTSGIAKVRGATLLLNQNQTERQSRGGQVRRSRRRHLAGPRHARLARQRHKPRRSAERELRPRADGALLPRHRPLRRGGRARSRTGADRMDRRQLQPRHRLQRRHLRRTARQFHDEGSKTILGHTGNFDGYDAIDIILNHTDSEGSVSGRFLGSKLWTFFAGTWPPAARRRRAAVDLRLRPLDPRGRPRDPARARVLRGAHAEDVGPKPGRVRRGGGADARGHERLLGGRERARRHGAGSLQPAGRQGLGLGPVLDEHGLSLLAGLAGQHALDEPRVDGYAVRSGRGARGTRRFDGRGSRGRARRAAQRRRRVARRSGTPGSTTSTRTTTARRGPGPTPPRPWTKRCGASSTSC